MATNERIYRCYINDYCIGCKACVETAPRFFAMNGRTAQVLRQPENISLLPEVREAQAVCPVGAVVLDVWKNERRARPRPRVNRGISATPS